MRVVFTASGSRGDVQPMLALALSAQAAGHDVLLCAPPNFAGWVRGHQVPFQAVGIDAEAMLRRAAAAATSGAWAVLGAFRRALAEEFAAQFRDLPAALTGADLVIGGGVSLAAPTLCEERGVPFVFTIYAPTMLRGQACQGGPEGPGQPLIGFRSPPGPGTPGCASAGSAAS